jgi:hypothetical protein
MIELVPEIDSNIPIPASLVEAMPELSPQEELDMRARTVKMISDLTGEPIIPGEEDKDAARHAVENMVRQPDAAAQLATYSNGTIAYLAGMVAQHDSYLVKDLAELKKYVVNSLVAESTSPDPKIRMQALRALGEVDGVDAFKKRTETTIKHQSIEEVENEIMEMLSKLESRTINVQAKVVHAPKS